MGRSPRPRSSWVASGSSPPRTWTRRWPGQPGDRPPAVARLRSGRSRTPARADMPGAGAAAIERTYRESSGIAVATLIRVFGDIDLAEDAVAEAFAVAAQRWPEAGVPANPGGWIVTTARNKALDRLRRESSRHGREAEAVRMLAGAEPPEVGPVPDDRLRLIFTCCHPALAAEAQIAL